MNKKIVVLLCSSSFVAACGGSDNRPAQSAYDPQTTSATTEMPAPTPMTTPPAATVTTPDPTAPSTIGTSPGQTYPSTDTSSSTTGSAGSSWGTGSTAGSSAGTGNTTGASNATGASNSSATTPSHSNTGATPPAAPAPDNSGVNKRDKNSGAVTPMDQGTSDGERRITANVRKLVVADKSLSFTAKNVKIITVGTKVTLRGPVKSDQEKSAIEAYARGIAGVTEVDDQLEVKK